MVEMIEAFWMSKIISNYFPFSFIFENKKSSIVQNLMNMRND